MNLIDFQIAKAADAERLAAIRVEAMQPSLEAVGRFDPIRAKHRFLSSFVPEDTQLILLNSKLIGLFVVRDKKNHLWIDHLYLKPDFQGIGIGRHVIERIQQKASIARKSIQLGALKDSPANKFYASLGFTFVREVGPDNYYIWNCKDTLKKEN